MGRPPAYDEKALIDAIIECLWEKGYAATPVSSLVEETGVNAASLYARFGSKKGIMLAALNAYAERTIEEISAVLKSLPPGEAQIRAVLRHALHSFADPRARGCFLVNSITNVSQDTPDFTEALARYMGAIRGLLEVELAKAPGLRPGLSPTEAALLVQVQIWGIKLMSRMHLDADMGEAVVRQTLQNLFPAGEVGGDAPGNAPANTVKERKDVSDA